ncbi:MAG TPA: hypothetical protein VGQ52_17970 [Gemmatimonadaceae bacterium]|jgi:hypothetical protein|nr:hypothetical protein [Gemmatimonadaceae bacterium]
MLVRLQGRALWFRAHPNDFLARPKIGAPRIDFVERDAPDCN